MHDDDIFYETFYVPCDHCSGKQAARREDVCRHCYGSGEKQQTYIRYCSYPSREECEWGGDCKFCEDAEPLLEY